MKTIYLFFLLLGISIAQDLTDRVVILPIEKAPKEVPLFFSASATVDAQVDRSEITTDQQLTFHVLQGKPQTLSLSLNGVGDVLGVTGEGLRDWSVRVTENGSRFLDVRPILADGKNPIDLQVVMKTYQKITNETAAVLLAGPGAATGFSLNVNLTKVNGIDLKIASINGLSPVGKLDSLQFLGTGNATLGVHVSPDSLSPRDIEMVDLSAIGTPSADGTSVSFRVSGSVRATKEGASLEMLGGGAALSGIVSGDGWHIALRQKHGTAVYELVADREGEILVALDVVVPLTQKGDWRSLEFKMPAGVVVPITLEGLGETVSFNRENSVVPEPDGKNWRGFLPADGDVSLAWRASDAVADGSLFFSSSETADIRVGSGLLRQTSIVDLRVLQGKLSQLSLSLNGSGEILSVSGEPVLGWSVTQNGAERTLEVKLSRPIEGNGRIVIESQSALGTMPVKATPLRVIPKGSIRHNGWLRVANEGAVRIEVADARGLIQLAPTQFPGGVDEKLRQVFVYRFPSANYEFAIQADQVLPEIGVTEVSVYEMGETDRRITSDLEMDIREAPIRDWEIAIPADFAVAAVTGAEVADYSLASEVIAGKRHLKILFKKAVADRQLVQMVLEKNQAAKEGQWTLPPVEFPGVKSRRGYIGVVATAGYRLTAGKTTAVAEVPVTFFPKMTSGLQQAFRIREGNWSVEMAVTALGQSVQADVFHLYSLRSGGVYGSVLINYFVVGAPATQWRIQLPDGVGNIDVTGQNVGRDWRREGNVVVVPLAHPILGAGTVLLTFDQPMSSRGGDFSPGDVHPLDVQAERGFVQVVSPLQVKHQETKSGQVLEIVPNELPAEFRLLSNAPTLGVWQYTARDFKIGMKIDWYDPAETVDQVVDFLKLSSQVSRDGQWVSDARFFVKSKGRNAIRMALPKDVSLWEAQVDGAAVNVRKDGDDTLIPLPLRSNPNQTVEVMVRYGATSKNASRPRLIAPVLEAPVVISEWTVSGDEERQLVPRGGNVELVRPVLAETGWAWMGRHFVGMLGLIVLGISALSFGRTATGGARRLTAILCGIGFIAVLVGLALSAAGDARGSLSVLEYSASVVKPGAQVFVEIGNVSPWVARTGWGMAILFVLGMITAGYGVVTRRGGIFGGGFALVMAAFLSIHGGTVLTLGVVALVALWWVFPRIGAIVREARRPKMSKVAAVVLLFGAMSLNHANAEELTAVRAAESIVQDWQIHDGRLHGTMQITLRGTAGDRYLLLEAPATLSGFEGTGLRVMKEAGKYFLIAENNGLLSGKANFEMPLADPAKGWPVPGGGAAMRQVTVSWDQGGWEFQSTAAAKVEVLANLNASQSGAVLLLDPTTPAIILARPKQRDINAEETRFFSEVSNLYLPGPGVVSGRHRVSIRPVQGRVSSLTIHVPDGFTVSDVVNGPVGAWRFDPSKRELRVPIEPAQAQTFDLTVETQRGEGTLPMDLSLEPLRVSGAAGEVGLMALAFGDDTQMERIDVEGLSRVNPADFDSSLIPHDQAGHPLALLQSAYRYGSGSVKAQVKVTAVAPEIRSEFWQLVSLGEDRLVVSDDLTVAITRAGIFRLEVEIPDGLEIESATGEGLNHWSEEKRDKIRILTLHLSGKTIGQRVFHLTLTGRPTGPQAKWSVPRLSVRGASRETGVVIVTPDRGFQVLTADRKNVSSLDPRELIEAPKESARAANRPGALAYRVLQGDWNLDLSISRLEAWVSAQVDQDVTLREGQLLTRTVIYYKIDNASVKNLRVKIPGLDATAAATVRASGVAVADLAPVPGEDGLWEIRFQRGVAGETDVVIEYQRMAADEGKELLQTLVLENVKKLVYYVTVRAGGRLELESVTLPRGWQKTDWTVVRSALGQAAGNVAPLMTFRVAEPEGPLPVILKRHSLADLQKLRVSEGHLTTLVSPSGHALTAVDLNVQLTGKETLRLNLPKGASLYNVFVNDEGASLVRDGDAWMFYVFPRPEAGRPSSVRFVYSSGGDKGPQLEGPVLNAPMENLTWNVILPEGMEMIDHSGDFELKQNRQIGRFTLEDYQTLVQSKKQSDSSQAVALLDQANGWLAAGDQEKAGIALGNAVRSKQLDAASGEDARVQLRQLKTQQAVLGLNTRRQKLLLDHHAADTPTMNSQLERAAAANPVLRGGYNYDPKQFDQFLEGNTVDENSALKAIADRIVSQQIAADAAPAALDVTIPERGNTLTFIRSVQVDGTKPMVIDLKLGKKGSHFPWVAGFLCLVAGAMATRTRIGRHNLPE